MPPVLSRLYWSICVLLLTATVVAAKPVSLQWDPSADANVVGYVVRYGTQPGSYSTQFDVGNRTTFQLPAMPAGRYYFVVQSYTADGMTSGPSPELAADIQTLAPEILEHTAEFGAPVGGDVLLYNSATGAWQIQLSAPGSFQALQAGLWRSGWTIKIAEFNGDNLADLLFYKSSTGEWYRAIDLGGGQFDFYGGTWMTGADLTVLDLNGDGRSDVFAYNPTTGQWFAGKTAAGPDFSYTTGTWAPGWTVYPADFDGDFRADLFLYNRNAAPDPRSGLWYRVFSQPDGSFAYDGGAIRWAPDFDVTPGDFTGDGLSDLFLYRANGDYYVVSFNRSTPVYRPGKWVGGWITRRGDFDGDGVSDLFLYNPTSGNWYVTVTQRDGSFAYAGGVWRSNWQVTVTDLDYDGRSDILLYDPSAGTAYQCLTRGFGVFQYDSAALGAGWTIVTGR